MPRFEISQAIALIRQQRPTILPGVPTLFNALLNHPDFGKVDFTALKVSLGGGMAVQ